VDIVAASILVISCILLRVPGQLHAIVIHVSIRISFSRISHIFIAFAVEVYDSITITVRRTHIPLSSYIATLSFPTLLCFISIYNIRPCPILSFVFIQNLLYDGSFREGLRVSSPYNRFCINTNDRMGQGRML